MPLRCHLMGPDRTEHEKHSTRVHPKLLPNRAGVRVTSVECASKGFFFRGFQFVILGGPFSSSAMASFPDTLRHSSTRSRGAVGGSLIAGRVKMDTSRAKGLSVDGPEILVERSRAAPRPRTAVDPLTRSSPGTRSSKNDSKLSVVSGDRSRSMQENPPELRIFGGEDTDYLTKPVVRLLFKSSASNPNKSGFVCTGTIISDAHILTAAHCLEKQGAQEVKIYPRGVAESRFIKVTGHVHPSYNDKFQVSGSIMYPDWDLAILEVANPKADFKYAAAKSNRMSILVSQHSKSTKLLIRGTGSRRVSGDPDLSEPGVVQSPPLDYPLSIHTLSNNRITGVASIDLEVCKGDSGGPAINVHHFGLPLQVGVFSGFDGPPKPKKSESKSKTKETPEKQVAPRDRYCPLPGAKMYWSTVGSKRGWIESVLKKKKGSGFTCAERSMETENGEARFISCWEVPALAPGPKGPKEAMDALSR